MQSGEDACLGFPLSPSRTISTRTPREYPAVSLATTGTHDTDTLREWWESAPQGEREAMASAYPEFTGRDVSEAFTPEVHRRLLAPRPAGGSSTS